MPSGDWQKCQSRPGGGAWAAPRLRLAEELRPALPGGGSCRGRVLSCSECRGRGLRGPTSQAHAHLQGQGVSGINQDVLKN